MNSTQKISSAIIVLSFTLLHAGRSEDTTSKPVAKLPAINVTLTSSMEDGRILSEVSSQIAQYPGEEFFGMLPIKMGEHQLGKLLVVNFAASSKNKSAIISFDVSDAAQVLEKTREGTTSVRLLELLSVKMPRRDDNVYKIYSSQNETLTIRFELAEEDQASTKQEKKPNKAEMATPRKPSD